MCRLKFSPIKIKYYTDVTLVWESKPIVSTAYTDERCFGVSQNTFRHVYLKIG